MRYIAGVNVRTHGANWVKADVDITNIFNVEYKETNLVTMPGRWAKAGVRFSFYK